MQNIMFLMVVLFLCSALPCLQAEAAELPYSITPQQEQSLADFIINEENIMLYDDCEILERVQKKLADENGLTVSEEASAKGGLQKARLSKDWIPNAFSFPAGLTIVTEGALEDCFHNYGSGADTNYESGHHLYGESRLAGVLAHEMGHWSRTDYLIGIAATGEGKDFMEQTRRAISESDWEKLTSLADETILNGQRAEKYRKSYLKREKAADNLAMGFLAKSEAFSPGSLAYFLITHDIKDEELLDSAPHPSLDDRLGIIFGWMKDVSGGRVSVGKDRRLYLDGIPFRGTGLMHEAEGADPEEKTLYLAGQLAKAVNLGMTGTDMSAEGDYCSEDHRCLYATNEDSEEKMLLGIFNRDSFGDIAEAGAVREFLSAKK